MTQQDLYTLIDEIVKVNPAATDTTKLQGARHRELLKYIVDFITANGGGSTPLSYDWSKPSERFGNYSSNDQDFITGFYKFMHPSKPPQAALSAVNPVRERGSSTAVTLNYATAPGSAAITSIVVNGVSLSPTQLSGTRSATTSPNTNTQYNMSVLDANGLGATATATVLYQSRFFIFTSSQVLSGLNNEMLSDTLNSVQGELTDSRYQSKDVNANGEYIYIAFSNAMGSNPTISINRIQDTSFDTKLFNYTNSQGFVEEFNLYSGENLLYGAYNVAVS